MLQLRQNHRKPKQLTKTQITSKKSPKQLTNKNNILI